MYNIKIILTGLLILCMLASTVSAFTTVRGNEITLIWDTRESRQLRNGSIEWIPRVDHGNGTTHYGHLKWIFHNYYTIQIPYILGLTFNGKEYYRQRFIWNEDRGSTFKVPIGDRNMKEYGECRAYEIRKGVCENV